MKQTVDKIAGPDNCPDMQHFVEGTLAYVCDKHPRPKMFPILLSNEDLVLKCGASLVAPLSQTPILSCGNRHGAAKNAFEKTIGKKAEA